MKPIVFVIAFTALLVTAAFAQQPMPPVDPYSVVLCEHVDFIGPCRTYTVEDWMRHKLVPSLGDFNDKASSIRVGSHVKVYIFQHAKYQGASGYVENDCSNLGDLKYISNEAFLIESSINDKVSSLIVVPKGRPYAGGGVTLGSRVNLDGQVEEGFFPLPERESEMVAKYPYVGSHVNDQADCIGIEWGVTVDLFEHSDFTGQRTRLPGYTGKGTKPNPGCYVPGYGFDLKVYGMNEKISSLIVYADKGGPTQFNADAVVISEHVDHVGASRRYDLEPGMRYRLVPNLENLNDKASSVIVGANVSVHVFEHANFGGRTAEFKDTKDSMDGSWNDRISSLIVAPRGVMLEGAVLSGGPFTPQYFFPLPEMATDGEARYTSVDGDLNDEANFLAMCGEHVSVTLHQDSGFAGDKREFPGLGPKPVPCAIYKLDDYQFDETASSLIVRTAAVAPTLVTPDIKPFPPPRGGDDTGTTKYKAPPALPDMTFQGTEFGSVSLELNSNRPGHDYRDFDLRQADPELCRKACAEDRGCRAFSYIKPGIQGEYARCWLKDGVPPAEHAPCCASGAKQ